PAVLLPRQSRVADPYVQIHRVGIEREPFLQRFQGGVIIALVVVTMRELVILLGAEEWVGHSCDSFSEHESRSSGLARIGNDHSIMWQPHRCSPHMSRLSPVHRTSQSTPRRTPGPRTLLSMTPAATRGH